MTPDQDTRTYRGRTLDELVPQIRQELGDDAVIVARRETTSGGVGGFFARREIEVEAMPGPESVARAHLFAERLAEASQDLEVPAPQQQRPHADPAVDAIPVPPTPTVDDLFPAPRAGQAEGLAALFNVGREHPAAEEPAPAPPAAEPPAPAGEPHHVEEPVAEEPPAPAEDPDAWLHAAEEVWPESTPVEEPAAPEAWGLPEPAPVEEPAAEEPSSFAPPAPLVPVSSLPPLEGEPRPDLLPDAVRAAAKGLVDRGLHPELAQAVAEEAASGLLPLDPGEDAAAAVREALARRIPLHRLRRGGGVIAFAGPGGAGKTRCVARLAAAHARHGALPVTVVTLRAPDGGAELTRLLAPYGVGLHAVESGAEGAARIAALRGAGVVVLDTPGVSPRAQDEVLALAAELEALAPDELHLTIPATVAPAVARELVEGVRALNAAAIALTHADETEQLGSVVGLAIETGLPLSYLARGQAVEAGLRPASPNELAAALVP